LLEVGGIELDEKNKSRFSYKKKNEDYLEYIMKMSPEEIFTRSN
jgi:hypothetical protein